MIIGEYEVAGLSTVEVNFMMEKTKAVLTIDRQQAYCTGCGRESNAQVGLSQCSRCGEHYCSYDAHTLCKQPHLTSECKVSTAFQRKQQRDNDVASRDFTRARA